MMTVHEDGESFKNTNASDESEARARSGVGAYSGEETGGGEGSVDFSSSIMARTSPMRQGTRSVAVFVNQAGSFP